MKIIGYVKKMMVLLLCLSVIGVNAFAVFANNVVVKADSRSKTEFRLYSYQAEDYLERCSVSEKLFNTISPSQTIYDAGVESGLAVSAAVWDSFTTLLDSFNKPSSMADKAFEKKDLYAGLLLSIFECEYKADTKARMDMSQIKNMNSLYKQFNSFCKANDYIYATSDKILFSDMSQVQKERLLSLTNTLADTDKDGDVWMSAMGDVDKALKVMDALNDVEKWCTYIMNCILLNDLNENTKQVLEDMYQESLKTGNLDMSLAFKESLDIARASGVELASEITEHFALEFTKKAAQEIIDTFWGDIKKSAQAANPYIAAFWLAYDGSKLLVKLVFNSDNITEKYCKMDALLQIRKVASTVYEKEKNTYKSTKNESDAAAFIASRDIMYECINVDCECASEYVDSVSNALWQKIKTLFKECNNLTELKRQIKSIQDSINSTHKTVQLNWVFWLQDDYPEEYENYKSLLVDCLPSVTMPKTSASVNVGEKIDLGGYELSDPCKFLDGKIKESWSTTNSKVAVVNSMGVVSAMKEGTAVIKLRFLDSSGNEIDGIYQDCTVAVKNPSISLNKTKTTLYVGDSEVLKVTLNGGNSKVAWSSSNKSVVTVSAGKIVAKKKGVATITAKANGMTAKCVVTVKTQPNKDKTENTTSSYQVLSLFDGGKSQKVGNTTFTVSSYSSQGTQYSTLYASKAGKKNKVVTEKDMGYKFITNGNTIYYSICSPNSTHTLGNAIVYQININGTSKKRLFSIVIKNSDGPSLDLAGYYQGKIYYTTCANAVDAPSLLHSYAIKTKKKRTIIKDGAGYVTQKQQYFAMNPFTGDSGPLPLKLYDAKRDKIINVSNKSWEGAYYIGNKFYYLEFISETENAYWQPYKCSVKRMNFDGSGKKTLIKTLDIYALESFSGNSITYTDKNGKLITKKFS